MFSGESIRASMSFSLSQHFRAAAHSGFPFFPGLPRTPVERVRALARPASRGGRLVGAARWLVRTIGWPFGAFVDARRNANGNARRLFDIWLLAVSRNIPPLEYRLYGLHDPARRASAGDYFYWIDVPALIALNARRGADNDDVQDKARFARLCASHDLPVVPTLAVFRRGRQVEPGTPFLPREPALWTKSLMGSGGAGAASWRLQEDGLYRNQAGERLTPKALSARLAQTACIVQPELTSHPLVAAISNGPLASLRIVTGLGRDDDADLVGAALYLAYGGSETINARIACRVEPSSGFISRALDLSAQDGEIERHPDTGGAIVGCVLPFWHESVALALRAHVAFRRFVFLGWDIALTPGGPVLLEANSGWGALHLQMLDGPIGQTAFGRIAAEELDAGVGFPGTLR